MKRFSWSQILRAVILPALILAISLASATATENLTVHFLDVGQGDSILLQFNGKNVLIDGGEQEMGPRVQSYLRDQGVSSLDLVVATHPHSDHIGGLLTILKSFPVRQVLDSGQVHTTSTFEAFLTLIDQKNIPYTVAQKGQKINLDPNLKIEVLSPPAAPTTDDLNQNSIVLKATYNKVSFLLTGDAEFDCGNGQTLSGDLKSDILKVAHHGSSGSASPAFLAKVRPAVSIIEVGKGNDYGHPDQETLRNLQKAGSKIYRTDLDGHIVVTTDGLSYTISTQKMSGGSVSKPSYAKTSALTLPINPIAFSTTASQQSFVGSIKSDKYHYPSCSGAQKIKSANRIWFSSSADARAHGYTPCKICSPP
jgi:competence protein ComEC